MWSLTKEISSESEPETELKVLDYNFEQINHGIFVVLLTLDHFYLYILGWYYSFSWNYNLQQFIGLAVQGHVVSGKQHARAL